MPSENIFYRKSQGIYYLLASCYLLMAGSILAPIPEQHGQYQKLAQLIFSPRCEWVFFPFCVCVLSKFLLLASFPVTGRRVC